MIGKTGAARVALETGCPVIPIAQWGPQEILAPYSKRLRLLPPKTVHVLAGPGVDLTDLRGRPVTAEVLRAASDRIVDAITAQLAELRGELPPPTRYDPARPTLRSTPPSKPRGTGDPGQRVRHGIVGDRIRPRARRRGYGCRDVGPAGRAVPGLEPTRRNPDYLPDIELPATVRATTDPAEAAAGADLVVLAVPSQTLRENLKHWVPALPSDALLVSLMKGIELGTAKRMSEVIAEVAGAPAERVAVVSGPNLAREIAQRQPAASVVACVDEERAQRIQQACHSPYFRRTRTPTSSAPSSAEPSRTSLRSRSGWPRASVSATTPKPA